MIEKYINLINNALRNQNNNIRSQAQYELTELRNTQTQSFFETCGHLLGTDQYDDFIRQSAATLLSRSTILKNQHDCFYWDALPPQSKQKIKQNTLQTLMNQNILIVKAGANALSSIVFVEVPRGQWSQIIDILAQNTQNSQFAAKNASIITIGFICQQFSFAYTNLDFRVCQQLLGGILVGLRSTESTQIVETSLTALRNSITFLSDLLKDVNVRNTVFNALVSFINNVDYVQTVYQGLFEFSKICYDFIGEYINSIQQFLVNHIRLRNDTTILALQLIDTIGTQYLDRIDDQNNRYQEKGNVQNYLLPMQNVLLPEVMSCFLIENQNDLEFSEMRNSANKTLGTMVSSGNREAADNIINGVAQIVKSEKVGHQQASALLLSTLCEYPEADLAYAQKYINDAFDHVISLLSSPEIIVVTNTLVGFYTIAQRFPHQFYRRQTAPDIFNKLFEIFSLSNNESMKNSVLKIFLNVTENFQNTNNILLDKPEVFLAKVVNEYETHLQNFYGSNINYCGKISDIIINCLVRLQNREIISHMIDFLLQKYSYFNDVNNANLRNFSKSDLEMISLSLLSLIHTALLALQKFLPVEHLMANICSTIDFHLKRYGIDGEVIDVISSMVVTFKNLFERKAGQYWNTILHGLQMLNNQKCFSAALKCIGDFSRAYTNDFSNKINQIMKRLLGLIHQNIERNLKVAVISCIGDMLLGLGTFAQLYIQDIINICDLCFTAVYQLSTFPPQKEYVQKLKLVLVELYACLIFSVMSSKSANQYPASKKIVSHFDKLVVFVIRTCERSQNPTIEYLKNALFLIFDQISFLWQHVDLQPMLCQALNSSEIQQLVMVVRNLENREDLVELKKQIETRYLVMNNRR